MHKTFKKFLTEDKVELEAKLSDAKLKFVDKYKSDSLNLPRVKSGGKYINPADVDIITKDLLKMKIFSRLPVQTFSNVVEWRWVNKIVKLSIYPEYGILSKKVSSPAGWYHPTIWILKATIPLGAYESESIDEIDMIKKAVRKASKAETENWSKKINISQLTKKLKNKLMEILPKMWFAVEKMKIKHVSPIKKIIYVPLVGAGVGHTDQQRLYQTMFDVSVDEFNIVSIIQGNIEGAYNGGDWRIGPSDLIGRFAPWQPVEEILDAILEFAGRY